jgi:hypothetical protein
MNNMNRILIVFETFNYSFDVVKFAIELAKKDGSHLLMKFLKPLHADDAFNYPFPNDLSISNEEREGKEKENMKLIKADLRIFRDQCDAAGIPYNIESGNASTIEHVLEESAYVDLILAHASRDMGQYSLRELLTDTHCPVLLIPTGISHFDNVVLAYDGSTSSSLAIKLYAYLFPLFREKKTWLVNFNGSDKNFYQMVEWVKVHFVTSEVFLGSGDIKQGMQKFIENLKGNSLVVMGAFGRKGISRILHKSLSYTLLERTRAAIFSMHE